MALVAGVVPRQRITVAKMVASVWLATTLSITAMARAAALPSSVLIVRPSWPTQGLPSLFAIWPEMKTSLPVRTKGT